MTAASAPSDPPAVNPRVLVWAREESGWQSDRVARRVGVSPERLAEWEAGERQPTVRQLEVLAQFFHRPLGIFFLPEPPRLPPLAASYRRLPGIRPGAESAPLRLALRQMLNRRERAIALLQELGEDAPSFDGAAHLSEEPAAVGERLRRLLGVDVETQLGWRDGWQAWREWRTAAERLGLLVFQFGKVKLSEVRGLSILLEPLPVAAVNGKEMPEAKAFTLMHEIAHLMLAAGREEKPAAAERRSTQEWSQLERFVEVVAGHALIPNAALAALVPELGDRVPDTATIRRLSARFRVTPLAMATRLREAGRMTWPQYRAWRQDWEAYVSTLPPRKGGIATPSQKAVNRAGRTFVQLVLTALDTNRITSTDAARYLDLKLEHFNRLREITVRDMSDAVADE